MRLKLTVLAFSAILLLGFWQFSRMVKRGYFNNLDFAVTVKLQEKIDRSVHLRLADLTGNVMEGASFFAGPGFSVITALIIIVPLILEGSHPSEATKGGRMRSFLRVFVFMAAFSVLALVEIYGKTVIHHPAPPFFMIKNPTTVFPKYYINEQYSYPSGHAARAVFLSLAIIPLLIKKSRIGRLGRWGRYGVAGILGGLGIYVGLVSISRVYLGHHWLSDIIGGVLLGSGFGILNMVGL